MDLVTNNRKANVDSVFDTITDLRAVPLTKRDFNHLEVEYGAHKRGTKAMFSYELGCLPSFRLAAQIDLDKFHRFEDCALDWDQLIEAMDPEPVDWASRQEQLEDEFAQADGRC